MGMIKKFVAAFRRDEAAIDALEQNRSEAPDPAPLPAHAVTLRPAGPGDFPGIRSLLDQMPQWQTVAQSLPYSRGLVAVDGHGRVLGWLAGHHDSYAWESVSGYDRPSNWRCSFVEWLLVDEDCRSAGIGAALMERFAIESSEAGRDTIIVSPQAGDDEQALLKFYYRLGYRRTVSGHVHRGPHGQQEDTLLPEDEMEAVSRTMLSPAETAELEEIMRRYRGSLGL